MKKIDQNNPIFQSKDFLQDKYMFYIILLNLSSDDVLLYSDEENYVICRGKEGLPTWIWSKEHLSMEVVREIVDAMKFYLNDFKSTPFTCKKQLYNLLNQYFNHEMNISGYFEMGTLYYHGQSTLKLCDGKIAKATMDDQNALFDIWVNHGHEMQNIQNMELTQIQEKIQSLITSDTLYVWKNQNGEIVCMAYYSIVNHLAKISGVITLTSQRNKGYASNLVYGITKQLLKDGIVPMLYTDYHYAPSNKAYLRAGFIFAGVLVNFSCGLL